MSRPLLIQLEIDKAEFTSLIQHRDRVLAERAAQDEKWKEEANLPDGTGDHYARQMRHYQQLCDMKMANHTNTYANIFLEEVFELVTTDNSEDFNKEAAQVEAVLRKWIAARARRPFVRCKDDCPDNCRLCNSGEWDLMCDECRFYIVQDH